MHGRVLLTGASGFVGNSLYPALVAAGRSVRCATRDAARAARGAPDREWVTADVGDERATARALEGCDAAFYLVHDMASGGHDYRRRERLQAERFSRAADRAEVGRVVYLGGIAPSGRPSEHLRSRLEIGEILRGGRRPCLELRASMIIGHGSLSWLIVRDLAARLPWMVLPRWLESRTEPVAVADVVTALVGSLDVPLERSASLDLPGPVRLTGRAILERTARLLGLAHPRMIEVPLLSPRLSSQWLRLVTRADWSVARELVAGLATDVLARDDLGWAVLGHAARRGFDEAARLAIDAERRAGRTPGPWGLVERARAARHPRLSVA